MKKYQKKFKMVINNSVYCLEKILVQNLDAIYIHFQIIPITNKTNIPLWLIKDWLAFDLNHNVINTGPIYFALLISIV